MHCAGRREQTCFVHMPPVHSVPKSADPFILIHDSVHAYCKRVVDLGLVEYVKITNMIRWHEVLRVCGFPSKRRECWAARSLNNDDSVDSR
jgi:hypothetical protein